MGKHPNIVQQIHRKQRLRHVTANKVSAALTALRHLQEGKPVSPKLLEWAISDLETLMERLDRKGGEGDG